MSKDREDSPSRARIVLDGFPEGKQGPRLAIHALDAAGKVIGSIKVEADGSFPIDENLSEKAARIIIGPADAKPEDRRTFYSIAGAQFRDTIQVDRELALGGQIWQPWFPFRRCVSGKVRRCFPWLHVLADSRVTRNLSFLPEMPNLVHVRPLARSTFLTCS